MPEWTNKLKIFLTGGKPEEPLQEGWPSQYLQVAARIENIIAKDVGFDFTWEPPTEESPRFFVQGIAKFPNDPTIQEGKRGQTGAVLIINQTAANGRDIMCKTDEGNVYLPLARVEEFYGILSDLLRKIKKNNSQDIKVNLPRKK